VGRFPRLETFKLQTMKRIAPLLIPVTMLAFVACNNGRAYNPDTQINYPPANTQPVNAAATIDTGKNPQGVNVQPMTVQPNLPAKTGGALNPAHGQPGHRCDIAVGAPLNSPAAATTATTTPTTTAPSTATTIPKPVTINPQPAAQKVAPGMNPAHGQPGHRCDIAVGAPLNSPAAATTTPQVSPLQPQPLQVTPVAPAKKDSANN
jgi:hypothetical protein